MWLNGSGHSCCFLFCFFKWNWHISCTTFIFLTTRIPNLNYSGWLNHFNYRHVKHIQYSYRTTIYTSPSDYYRWTYDDDPHLFSHRRHQVIQRYNKKKILKLEWNVQKAVKDSALFCIQEARGPRGAMRSCQGKNEAPVSMLSPCLSLLIMIVRH